MTEAEKEAKLKVFEKLKIHPKEKEENQYLIAKGEALYVQSTGALRDAIGEWLGYFTSLLEGQDEGKIRKQRKKSGRCLCTVGTDTAISRSTNGNESLYRKLV